MSLRFKTFVINLDRSPQRLKEIKAQLNKLGIEFERFSAFDGKYASDETLSKYYSAELNRKKYYTPLSKTEIACYISHLKVCEKVVSENLDYAIILEDDLILSDGFRLIPSAIEAIKFKWNYIKLIAPFKAKKITAKIPIVFNYQTPYHTEKWECESIYNDTGKIDLPYLFELVRWRKPPIGAQAYAITKGGAKEFIEKRSTFFRPIDVDLQFTWENNLNIIGLRPFFCRISDAESDIGKRSIKPHYPLARLIYKLKWAITSLFFNKSSI